MLTSYSEYQFEKMISEMGPPGVGSVDATNASTAVPMQPPAPPPAATPGTNTASNPQQMAQIKQSLTQAWQLISKTPAAKDVMPLFSQILNKIGFKVTGQGAQMVAGQTPGQTGNTQKAQPVTLPGLNQNIVQSLQQYPNLSRAISSLGRHKDMQQPLVQLLMMAAQNQRFPDWEKNKIGVPELKQKLIQYRLYNPLSYGAMMGQ